MQHDAATPTKKAKRAQGSARTANLRQLLASPGILQVMFCMIRSYLPLNCHVHLLKERMHGWHHLQGPCCHDGLSARLIERAGVWRPLHGPCTHAASCSVHYAAPNSTGHLYHQTVWIRFKLHGYVTAICACAFWYRSMHAHM